MTLSYGALLFEAGALLHESLCSLVLAAEKPFYMIGFLPFSNQECSRLRVGIREIQNE